MNRGYRGGYESLVPQCGMSVIAVRICQNKGVSKNKFWRQYEQNHEVCSKNQAGRTS